MKDLWASLPFSVRLTITVLLALLLVFVMTASSYAATTVPSCSWDKPGANPYRGSVPGAIDNFTSIPSAARVRLKQRMERLDYDDVAVITRDRIAGRALEYDNLRDMHFGKGRICTAVSREKWLPSHEERGLVYCELSGQTEYCVIVPTVCNNVSRIDPITPLLFEPPAAGPAAPPALFSGPVLPPQATFAPPASTSDTPSGTFRSPPPFSWFPTPMPPAVYVVRPPGQPPQVVYLPPAQPPVTWPPIDPPPTGNPPVDPPAPPASQPPTTPPVDPPPTTNPPTNPPVDPPVILPPPVTPPVPEPGTLALVATGLLFIGATRYRRVLSGLGMLAVVIVVGAFTPSKDKQ